VLRVEHGDTPGTLYRRTRSPFLWLRYTIHGAEQRESSRTADIATAEKMLRRRLAEVEADAEGLRPFVGAVQHRVRVKVLLDALVADYELRGVRSLPQVKAHLIPIRKAFDRMKAEAVTAPVVDRWIQARLRTRKAAQTVIGGEQAAQQQCVKPATINREIQLLGQALRMAVKNRQLASAPQLRKLPERNVRIGFLDRADFEAVEQQLPDHLKDVARFAYHSAWRKGEVTSLLWSDVSLAEGVIRLREEESKNEDPRLLPLEGELREIIQRRHAARTVVLDGQLRVIGLVFHRDGRPLVDFRKAWATACKAAGRPRQLFHDLRRSGVRNLVRAGVDPAVAMKISGHKTRSVFDRYNIVDERDLRAAVSKTDTFLKAQSTERTVIPLRAAAGREGA
jgi:integrase